MCPPLIDRDQMWAIAFSIPEKSAAESFPLLENVIFTLLFPPPKPVNR